MCFFLLLLFLFSLAVINSVFCLNLAINVVGATSSCAKVDSMLHRKDCISADLLHEGDCHVCLCSGQDHWISFATGCCSFACCYPFEACVLMRIESHPNAIMYEFALT